MLAVVIDTWKKLWIIFIFLLLDWIFYVQGRSMTFVMRNIYIYNVQLAQARLGVLLR